MKSLNAKRILTSIFVFTALCLVRGDSPSDPNDHPVAHFTSAYTWSQVDSSDDLSTPGSNTIHLTPCPPGLDTTARTDLQYYVYLSNKGTAESVPVKGGACVAGVASGKIVVDTKFAHGAGFTVGSATAGIQEALNDCSVAPPSGQGNCHVTIPPTGANANVLEIYAPIIIKANHILLDGSGAALTCLTRSRCIQVGNISNHAHANDYEDVKIFNLRIGSALQNIFSAPITNTSCTSRIARITVGSNVDNFVFYGPGDPRNDWVDVQNTQTSSAYWGIHQIVGVSGNTISFADAQCVKDLSEQSDFGSIALENAAIEDNLNHTVMSNIDVTNVSSRQGFFNNGIVVDNDQQAIIEKLNLAGVRCDPANGNYCGSAVYMPGPFGTNAAVPVIKDSQMSLQCGGNGVTNYAGNTLSVSDSVIQGYSQWGIKTGGFRGAGIAPTKLANVYEEVGSCKNVLGNIGTAGIISYGQQTFVNGGEGPTGFTPTMANQGGSPVFWYVVIHDVTTGTVSVPYLFGAGSLHGTGDVKLTWPIVVEGHDVITYDILRVPQISPQSAPYGTGKYAVATAINQCKSLVCSAMDRQRELDTYSVPSNPTFIPFPFFWAGGWVGFGGASLYTDFIQTASTQNNIFMEFDRPHHPEIFAHQFNGAIMGNPLYFSALGTNSVGNNYSGLSATILQTEVDAGAPAAGLKGRLIFEGTYGSSLPATDLLTIVDSRPLKSASMSNNRAPADPEDVALGTDTACSNNGCGLAMRSPTQISLYLNHMFDDSSWIERLTPSQKSFRVPVTTNSQLISSMPTGTAPLVIASTTPVPNLTVSNHPKVQACGTTTSCSAKTLPSAQIVQGTVTLINGNATVHGFNPGFTSTSTFNCTCSDNTKQANGCKAIPASPRSIAITGTGTDTASYICAGN